MASNIKVIDKFLPTDVYYGIRNYFTSDNCPWVICDGIASAQSGIDDWQLAHPIYVSEYRSGSLNFIRPIIDRIQPDVICRIKANSRRVRNELKEDELHTDFKFVCDDYYTGIYYVNSNDGYTSFEDGTKVDSIGNRMVIFKGNTMHGGSTHTDTICKWRVVINFNWFGGPYAQ
tara:strand:+ start:26 stop:547 length:522 start_codon:yes stop_codon:yes gene_type:complete